MDDSIMLKYLFHSHIIWRRNNDIGCWVKVMQSSYDSLSDVGESRVWFASKNLTPCRMHWNAFRATMEFREKRKFFTLRPPARKRREISGWVQRVKWCLHTGQQMPCWQKVAAGPFWPCFACPKLGDAGRTRVASKNRRCYEKAGRSQFWLYSKILLRENF